MGLAVRNPVKDADYSVGARVRFAGGGAGRTCCCVWHYGGDPIGLARRHLLSAIEHAVACATGAAASAGQYFHDLAQCSSAKFSRGISRDHETLRVVRDRLFREVLDREAGAVPVSAGVRRWSDAV